MINEEKRIIQEEALEALRKNNYYGAVILPTGTGKSYVLVEALKDLYKEGMRVLYTCDSQRLRDIDFIKEMEKWGAEEYVDKIERKCYASAHKLKDEEYDILLADEGDYGLTPTFINLFLNNKFKHIIFVSATLEQKKRALARKICKIVYEKKVKEIEDRQVINKSQIYLVPYLLNENENRQYLNFNARFRKLLTIPERTPSVKKQIEFLTLQRMHFLAGLESSAYICRRLMNQLYNENKDIRLLIFCNSTTQADKVCKYSYHTKNEKEGNLDKFNNDEISAIATCGKIDRGINLNKVNSIIMEYIARSETKAIQKFGRGKRLSVDELLNIYILIPYYQQHKFGGLKTLPTIVYSKAMEACKDLGIEKAINYIVK